MFIHPNNKDVKIGIHNLSLDQDYFGLYDVKTLMKYHKVQWSQLSTKLICGERELNVYGNSHKICSALMNNRKHRVIANDPDSKPLCMTVFYTKREKNLVDILLKKIFLIISMISVPFKIWRGITVLFGWIKAKKIKIILSSGPICRYHGSKEVWNIMWDRSEATIEEISSVLNEYVKNVRIYELGEGEQWKASKGSMIKRVGDMGHKRFFEKPLF